MRRIVFHMSHSLPKLASSIAFSLLLAACGGGGSGGGDNNSAPAPIPQTEPNPVQLFNISGTISASPSQTVDGDTNDPAREVRPNDSVSTAQAIPSPTTLGGYVNQPGAGAEGRSQLTGDTDDYFRVELLAGQRVTLLVADYERADADLYLHDAAENIIDFSIDTGNIESLTVPENGTYTINVFAYEGATNYVLAIGTQNSITRYGGRQSDIIPWQTVIRYRESEGPATASIRERIRERLGIDQRAGAPGRERLMALRRGLANEFQHRSRLGSAALKKASFIDRDLAARWETLVAIKSLRRDTHIEHAEPNYRIKALGIPDDPAYSAQWHYPLINLPAAWDTSTGDPGVIVAVVDTGILANHPDLAGQLVPGYDFVRDPASALDGNGIDPNPEDPGRAGTAGSGAYHGSHVGGTIAAASDNGLGVAGVAYSSRLMPVRALGADGEGTSYDVDQAIRFAAGLANDSGTVPNKPANIINLSLGGGPFSAVSQALYRELRAAGITVVAAAGNEASLQPQYPASYDGVISVSAVDAQAQITPYSNTGSTVDVAAPGGNNSQDFNGDGYPDGVLSTSGSGSGTEISYAYTFISGTSMAAPHVAGILALMKSVNPDLTPADIDALLAAGDLSDDLGAPGRDDEYGHGLINAQRAVLAALNASGGTPAENPLLSASASTLNFTTSSRELELELRNGGFGELEVLSLNTSETWLQLSPADVDSSGLGSYRVTVARQGLDSGVYSASIVASSTVNNLVIQVLMSVGSDASPPDVGVVYILLEDTTSGEVIDQFAASANQGSYRFTFNDIPAGSYEIYAGSDTDNDLLICDPGEACGAWLTIDQPGRLELEADLEAVEFPIEYLVSLPDSSSVAPVSSSAPGSSKTVAKKRLHRDH